jgi:signal transduction histidine kinase
MKDDLQALETQARDVLKEMRLLLGQLRNDSAQETVNLTEAVQSVCDAFAQRSGPEGGSLLSVTLKMSQGVIIQKNIADEVLWIMRESLQNIVKHSESRTAQVEVIQDVKLHIMIQDDGNGFDLESLPAGHYGLRGMRERVMTMGGDFKIDSKIGSGTKISFSMLLPRE